MASTNQSPFYQKAESKFLDAQTDSEKIKWLDEMIKECPKHKSAEKMLANLKTRRKKLLVKLEKSSHGKKGSNAGKTPIKKEDMQAVIVGKSNSGKSSLLNLLTNVHPQISEFPFTTKKPIVGMMPYNHNTINIQLIDIPSIESEYYDKGLVHTTDTVLIVITNISDLKEIEEKINPHINSTSNKIIIFNKADLLSTSEKRKVSSTLQSKKYNFILISTFTNEGISELKDKIFLSFNKIRVFTKEPGKEKSKFPIVLNKNSVVKNVAEKILHGFSSKIKEARVTGPSSKFPYQKVSLNHELKDLDIVEFKIK